VVIAGWPSVGPAWRRLRAGDLAEYHFDFAAAPLVGQEVRERIFCKLDRTVG
jgi:hypothetical protein